MILEQLIPRFSDDPSSLFNVFLDYPEWASAGSGSLVPIGQTWTQTGRTSLKAP